MSPILSRPPSSRLGPTPIQSRKASIGGPSLVREMSIGQYESTPPIGILKNGRTNNFSFDDNCNPPKSNWLLSEESSLPVDRSLEFISAVRQEIKQETIILLEKLSLLDVHMEEMVNRIAKTHQQQPLANNSLMTINEIEGKSPEFNRKRLTRSPSSKRLKKSPSSAVSINLAPELLVAQRPPTYLPELEVPMAVEMPHEIPNLPTPSQSRKTSRKSDQSLHSNDSIMKHSDP